jgi:hypothetical protein
MWCQIREYMYLRKFFSFDFGCVETCWYISVELVTSPDTQISYTNKTDCHDITEILLKVALSTIKQTNQRIFFHNFDILLKGKPVLRQNIIFFSHYFCIYRTKLYTVVTFQTEIRYKLHRNISTGFHTSKIKREKLTQVLLV